MKILTAIMTVLMMAACGNAGAGKMSDADVEKWCSESEWFTALPFEADASVDRRAFAEQNRLSPEVWKKAFEFLSRKDLASLAEGTYELDDNGLFATVSYYTTKDSALFEAHRKYIDIQYVAEGCERIDLAARELGGISIDQLTSGSFFSEVEDPYEAILSIARRHPMNQFEVESFLEAREIPADQRQALMERLGQDPGITVVPYKGIITYRVN